MLHVGNDRITKTSIHAEFFPISGVKMKRSQSKHQSTTSAKRSKANKPNINHLPEDALHELFQRVPSLRDKFSLAGVNQKFRRCMLKEIKKTTSLCLDGRGVWLLNGNRILPWQWPRAIQVLAERTELREIVIVGSWEPSYSIYSAFLSSLPYLGKLVKFESEAKSTRPWFPDRIIPLLQDLSNLSILKIDVSGYELNKLNLTRALKGRALTEVDLKLKCQPHEMVELFQSLQPRTLKRIVLEFHFDPVYHWPSAATSPGLTIFETLRKDSWAALESISFAHRGSSGRSPLRMPAPDDFFEQLACFPHLRKCCYALDCTIIDKVLSNVIAYLKGSAASSHERVFEANGFRSSKGCEMLPLMRGVQTAVPDVDFTVDIVNSEAGLTLISFTSQNAVFKLTQLVFQNCRHNCIACHGFYPTVLKNLQTQAKQKANGHLVDFRLDRCKVGRLVRDLNINGATPRALSAIPSADGNAVDVNFQDENDQFTITVDTDYCFSDACIGCVVV